MDLFYMYLAGVLTGVGIVLTTHGAFEQLRIRRFVRRRERIDPSSKALTQKVQRS